MNNSDVSQGARRTRKMLSAARIDEVSDIRETGNSVYAKFAKSRSSRCAQLRTNVSEFYARNARRPRNWREVRSEDKEGAREITKSRGDSNPAGSKCMKSERHLVLRAR